MDRRTMESMLRKEKDGINGLSIKYRRMQDRTVQPLIAEAHKTEGDLRNFTTSGIIIPTEDYWISGEGRTPIVIREVQTTVEGMKKYALLEPQKDPNQKKSIFRSKKKKEQEDKKPVTYDVRYVYGEGIDFKKMAEDEAYAKAVIGLFQEERLQKKLNESYQLGSDTVYLGTIASVNGQYIKAGIKQYATAVVGIDSQLQEQHQAVQAKHESILAAQRKIEQDEERKDITKTLTREEWKQYLKELLSKYDLPEAATMLREAWDEKLEEKQTQGEQTQVDEDFREW